jgi:3-deoxy-alpha-D-manno-octulosonate 8-oxidase
MYRNLRIVPQLIFGRGSVRQLGDILAAQRKDLRPPVVFLIDRVHQGKAFVQQLPVEESDLVLFVDVDHEPKTGYVDELTERARTCCPQQPCAVVGIGGGSTLDLAKAVALMLTNPGSSSDYQGWDLVKTAAVYHLGIPTLAGTGAEVSRTTVLTGPTRKLGINSDFTPFDQIILDPDLLAGAPREQRFYTAMDCFIHASEALHGTFINEFARAFAEKSLAMCCEVFLGDVEEGVGDEMLMTASYLGGMSIAYSQVGICHALSYGLAYVLGVHHGIGNSIVFDYLEDYYAEDVRTFRTMMEKHEITLPRSLTRDLSEHQLNEMIRVALSLNPLWENALGPDWQEKMPPERVRELYLQM